MSNLTLNSIVENTIKHTSTNYDDAYAYLDYCLEKLIQNPALLNNLGIIFYKNIEYDLACRCFYFLLKHHDTEYSAHNNLSNYPLA